MEAVNARLLNDFERGITPRRQLVQRLAPIAELVAGSAPPMPRPAVLPHTKPTQPPAAISPSQASSIAPLRA